METVAEKGAHATKLWAHAIAHVPAVQGVLRESGSRTLRVHHPTEAVRLMGLDMHRMQALASFEP